MVSDSSVRNRVDARLQFSFQLNEVTVSLNQSTMMEPRLFGGAHSVAIKLTYFRSSKCASEFPIEPTFVNDILK